MDKSKGKIIFKDKKITLEPNVDESMTMTLTDKYIQQLNPLELIAYEIAKTRLKTSFDIEKSIGFIGFKG
jgi:hypothetical protein